MFVTVEATWLVRTSTVGISLSATVSNMISTSSRTAALTKLRPCGLSYMVGRQKYLARRVSHVLGILEDVTQPLLYLQSEVPLAV